jgi:4-alpha-glucanotransferase
MDKDKRSSGVLLHITSLPSQWPIGDMGPEAYSFADFLSASGQKIWQILPLSLTDPIYGNSPYSSISAFAGNTLLISPQVLVQDGFLSKKDISSKSCSQGLCDYNQAAILKEKFLEKAYKNSATSKELSEAGYKKFCMNNTFWLDDFAIFKIIKKMFSGRCWNNWPKDLRDREKRALDRIKGEYYSDIEKEKFFQYLFFKQWRALKEHCLQKEIMIMGDIPIYVSYDSADVWANASIFKLNDDKRPMFVAGVPPDYFSSTGQLWGNPVYDWNQLARTKYSWWLERIGFSLRLFAALRIDHFRGLINFWQVPATAKTAVNGQWEDVPAQDFLRTVFEKNPEAFIVAEDLGMITPEVTRIREKFKIPGMKILQFAFSEDNPKHPYLPYMHERNSLVYTGTHDNDTVKGWFRQEADRKAKERLCNYIGRKISYKDISWELIRLAMASVSKIAITPFQDILGLGSKARMNTPSVSRGNWQWRFSPDQLSSKLAKQLFSMAKTYGRI